MPIGARDAAWVAWCDIRSSDDRRRRPGTPRDGARTTHRDTLWRSRARRSVHRCACRVRRRSPRAPRRIPERLSEPSRGRADRLRSSVAVADCTAEGAPANRWPTLFPHRRLTAARRLRGFVHPRLGEAPDASSSTVTRPRWRFTKSLSIIRRTPARKHWQELPGRRLGEVVDTLPHDRIPVASPEASPAGFGDTASDGAASARRHRHHHH